MDFAPRPKSPLRSTSPAKNLTPTLKDEIKSLKTEIRRTQPANLSNEIEYLQSLKDLGDESESNENDLQVRSLLCWCLRCIETSLRKAVNKYTRPQIY